MSNRLPKAVRFGPNRYRIRSALPADAFPEGKMGHCDHVTQEIVLAPRTSPGCQRDTFMHEVLHGLTFQACLDDDLGTKVEERVVARLAGPLLDWMRRNPQAVAYLVDESG